MAASAAVNAPADSSAEYSVVTRWIILVAVMLGTILEILDTSIVNVAIPDMMANLGATIDQINWVSTGYIVANVIVLPLTGWFQNQFGRRNYLVASIGIFVVASFLCGIATSLPELVAFRILQGAGGAALLSTAQATLLEVFPRKQLASVQAIFIMGVVAAPTFGPTLGGYITVNYSWPWIFFINVPLGILAGVLVFIFLRDSNYQLAKRPIDIFGIALLAVGLGSFQTVLEMGNREGWFESNLIAQLTAVSTLGIGMFVWWELRAKDPAVKLSILRNRGFAAGVIYGVVLGFGLYGGIFILPIFLQNIRQYDAMQTGLFLMPGGFVTVAALPLISRLVKTTDVRLLVGIGTLLFAACMFSLTQITSNTAGPDLMMPLFLRGAALSCMFLPLNLAALLSLPPEDVSYGTGMFNLARQLGGSAGIAALSTILDHRTAIHRAALVEHVSLSNPLTLQRLNSIQAYLMSRGSGVDQARKQALNMINQVVQRESAILAFEDCFRVIAVAFVLALPLLFLFKSGRAGGRPAPQMDH